MLPHKMYKVAALAIVVLTSSLLSTPAEAIRFEGGPAGWSCQVVSRVQVDGYLWTNVECSQIGGSGYGYEEPISFDLSEFPEFGGGGGGGFFDFFTTPNAVNVPNNPNPATCHSNEASRFAHAQIDADAWITQHSRRAMITRVISVTYDDGSTETWPLVANLTTSIGAGPIPGTLNCNP